MDSNTISALRKQMFTRKKEKTHRSHGTYQNTVRSLQTGEIIGSQRREK